ncbi:hypothetical protein AB2N08_21835 [Massilia aurea]|uniref:hypothetical protein n=1 Tax=Massilia aurea TaxID=373040 RepID=UPI0034636998
MSRSLPLLLLLSLSTTPALAASLQLCPGTPVVSPGAITAQTTAPDGSVLHAIVTEEPGKPQANCRMLPLPASVTGVQALHFLPPDARPGKTILLRGIEADKGKSFSVSEHTLVSDQPAPRPQTPMPFGASLLGAMQTRTHGDTERINANLKDGRLYLTCRAGARPAGVALLGPWFMPRAHAVLQGAFSGTGRFAMRIQDGASAKPQAALDLGYLDAGQRVQTARFALPEQLDRANWRQVTLACPQGAATLTLDALTLEAAGDADPAAAPRATWTWSPNEWRERAAPLLDWAAEQKIGAVFITVPLKDGAVADAAQLGAFVRQAGSRGIAVSAMEGAPEMVLPAGQAGAVARMRAYAAYNAAAADGARLKGVQYHIEPYALPAHVLPQAQRDRRYLELAAALHQAGGKLTLDFVVPHWWAGKTGLLDGLAKYADMLTVKSPRTDPEQIYRLAVPFLDWGALHGKTVRVALDAGPIGAGVQRRYERRPPGARGDLLVFELGGQKILLLLQVPAAHDKAQAYALAASQDIDAADASFHADKGALMRLLPQLESVFGTWTSFGGMALHDLR